MGWFLVCEMREGKDEVILKVAVGENACTALHLKFKDAVAIIIRLQPCSAARRDHTRVEFTSQLRPY
jgi:hypothetical protein